MSQAHLYIFDDRRARRWAPFTLTRPVGEILFGCMKLRERAERVFGTTCAGYVTRGALLGFDEPGAATTVGLVEITDEGRRVLLSSRTVLDFQSPPVVEEATRILVQDEVVGWILPEGHPLPSDLYIRDPAAWPWQGADLTLPGTVLQRPWDLLTGNTERIRRDVEHLLNASGPWTETAPPPGVHTVGDGPLSVADGATLEAGVVVDLRGGPVRLAAGAYVRAPARLTGPLYVGPDTQILGGDVGTSSLGPDCRVRGEVSDSVILGYTNKAHDGHLGHAVVGRWVNLGADTSNSDLKNNYSTVRVWTLDGVVDTGLIKMGCLIGDHVKTGIGTLISTGTVLGAGSNVFGGSVPPSVVPPFSWGTAADLRDYRLDRFLETAERSMARRGQALTPGVRRILEEAWTDTAGRRAE